MRPEFPEMLNFATYNIQNLIYMPSTYTLFTFSQGASVSLVYAGLTTLSLAIV